MNIDRSSELVGLPVQPTGGLGSVTLDLLGSDPKTSSGLGGRVVSTDLREAGRSVSSLGHGPGEIGLTP